MGHAGTVFLTCIGPHGDLVQFYMCMNGETETWRGCLICLVFVSRAETIPILFDHPPPVHKLQSSVGSKNYLLALLSGREPAMG